MHAKTSIEKEWWVGGDQERIYGWEKKEGLNVIKYNLKNEQQQRNRITLVSELLPWVSSLAALDGGLWIIILKNPFLLRITFG